MHHSATSTSGPVPGEGPRQQSLVLGVFGVSQYTNIETLIHVGDVRRHWQCLAPHVMHAPVMHVRIKEKGVSRERKLGM